MNVFDAKVVYDKPRENDSQEYGKSLSAALLPSGATDDKANFVYINGKPNTEDGNRLKALKKGDVVVVVEVQVGDRKPYFKLATLSDGMRGRMGGQSGAPVSQVPASAHATTLADAGEIDPAMALDRQILLGRSFDMFLGSHWQRLTTGTPEIPAVEASEENPEGKPKVAAKPGLGLDPEKAVDVIRNLAVSHYIEICKTHRRERF